MKRARAAAVLGTIFLFVLHNNWWSWEPDLTLVFGAIPIDIVYRVLWVVAASGVLWLALRGWWGTSK